MSSFTTRVELHDAKSEDYEKLYEFMNNESFSRTITSSDKITYQLPTAEYNYTGNIAISGLIDKRKLRQKKLKRNSKYLLLS